MTPGETVSRSLLDKPLYQLTEDDISQLTREDCRRFLKGKGMRRPSWNKSQAIQQVISLKALLETTPDTDAGIRKKLTFSRRYSFPSRTICSADTPVGQMTIFYSGKVNVYNDVPADKAQNNHVSSFKPPCVLSETLNATVAARHSAYYKLQILKLCPDTDMVPTIQTEAVESSTSRKTSLQRYLEKQKYGLSTAPTGSGPICDSIQMNPTFSSGLNERC
ncbi:hypothetical protein HAX54_027610 [Datura stramonium]|uniref:Protein TIFY n=1 Tax=Datura stramonium TaxID=4076 RepID=A0ABS8V347_DATST|nr:hypothetical protein [Datura stramonium]